MYGDRGFYVNRYGEVYDDDPHKDVTTSAPTTDAVTRAEMDASILIMKREFSDGARNMMQKIKQEFRKDVDVDLAHVAKRIEPFESHFNLTKNYIGLKDKRLVGVGRSIDSHDVVVKEELVEALKPLDDAIDLSDKHVLKMKNHRRIGTVSRSKEPYDVVVRSELMEYKDALHDYKTKTEKYKLDNDAKINLYINDTNERFVKLNRWKRKCADDVSEMWEKVFGAPKQNNHEAKPPTTPAGTSTQTPADTPAPPSISTEKEDVRK